MSTEAVAELKWFSVDKGYGFLATKAHGDIFLHAATMKRRFPSWAPPGKAKRTFMKVLVSKGQKGWAVDEVLSTDEKQPEESN